MTIVRTKLVASPARHWAMLPLLMGIVLGLSLSTVILFQPYNVTNIYIGLPGSEDKEVVDQHRDLEQKLLDFKKLMEDLHPGYLGPGSRSLLSEEVTLKAAVHYAVIVSEGASSQQVHAVQNTWGKDIPAERIDYYVPPEKKETEGKGENVNHNVTKLASLELVEIQVLRHVCKHRLNTTKWFFIGYDDSYVKVLEMESYLLSLEAVEDQVLYLGKPIKREPIGRICMPGPGSLLSYYVVAQLCPKLDACTRMKGHFETEYILGECIRKQLPDIQCSKDTHFQNLFLRFDAENKGPIIDPKNLERLNQAFTIFPVSDPDLLYGIHHHIYNKRLNQSLHLLQELKQVEGHMAGLLPQSNHEVDYGGTNSKDASWQLINQNLLMSRENEGPTLKISPLWKKELKMLSSTSMEYLYSNEEQSLIFSKAVNIYFRLNPLAGMDYIMDFEAKLPNGEDKQTTLHYFRVMLSRPFSPLEVSPVQKVGEPKRVTVLLVTTMGQDDLLQEFMKGVGKVLEQDQRLDIIIMRMKTKDEKAKKLAVLHKIVHSYETRFLRASFKVIDSPLLLSRARGVGQVLRESRPNDILFLADLSLTFNTSFLERCRHLPIQGQQAYFPIPFSKACPLASLEVNKTHSECEEVVSAQSGHWLVKSYSMSCVYAADILSALQKPGRRGIPKHVETEELYRGLVEKDYQVIRGADSGLVQNYWEERACPLDVVGDMQSSCVGLQDLEQLSVKKHLSELLFDHERKHTNHF